MSKVNSVEALRAKRSKRLAQKRVLPPIKSSSYHRPRTTFAQVELLTKCSAIDERLDAFKTKKIDTKNK